MRTVCGVAAWVLAACTSSTGPLPDASPPPDLAAPDLVTVDLATPAPSTPDLMPVVAPPPFSVAVPGGYGAMAVGDANGDGKLDLAVIEGAAVALYLGNGDGTLQPARLTTVTPAPTAIATLDANGDGRADFVAVAAMAATGTLLLGRSDGTFATSSCPATGDGEVVVGNFDGDAYVDYAQLSRLGELVVFRGDGAGNFASASSGWCALPCTAAADPTSARATSNLALVAGATAHGDQVTWGERSVDMNDTAYALLQGDAHGASVVEQQAILSVTTLAASPGTACGSWLETGASQSQPTMVELHGCASLLPPTIRLDGALQPDVDGDGWLDLYHDGTVALYASTGVHQPPWFEHVDPAPANVRAYGRFDGDATDDLVAATDGTHFAVHRSVVGLY